MSKVVLVTGASSGIGKQTAKTLAKAGYKVYGAARKVERMKDLEDEGITVLELDVANEDSVTKVVNTILNAEGSLDVLINNAGFGEYGAIETVSMDAARYQMEVNLFGAAHLTQLVLPKMRENKWGKIVNITSIGGKIATPFGGWYHASKFALEGLSDSLRNEVKPFGINVIVIEPGAVKTEWAEIAVDNMLGSGKDSPYQEAITKMNGALKASAEGGSSPEVIADLIQKAIEEESPKARYYGGNMAEEILTARKNMTDEEFDAMMTQTMQ